MNKPVIKTKTNLSCQYSYFYIVIIVKMHTVDSPPPFSGFMNLANDVTKYAFIVLEKVYLVMILKSSAIILSIFYIRRA